MDRRFLRSFRYAGLALLVGLALLACAQPAFAQSPAPLDITIQQGATWSVQLQLKTSTGAAVNLDGYTASAQIRSAYGAATPLATFTCAVSDATHGIVTVTLTATQTSALAAPVASAVWDCFLISSSSGTSLCVLAGKVQIKAAVTRP